MDRIYDSRIYTEMTATTGRAIVFAMLGILLLIAGISVFMM